MKYSIFTYGCQMNKNDSEMVSGLLAEEGWEAADSITEADVVLINTCSVRLHAEERAIGTIAALKKLGKRVIVMGCMAEVRGHELMERFPHVQAVVGPCYETEIPHIIYGQRSLLLGDRRVDFDKYMAAARKKAHSVFISIMKGCDDFCTYCIVPYTRGRVQSRPPDSVLEEVRAAVDNGAVEVTLLGQNVNDYGKDLGEWNFVKLVEQVAKVPGLRRIRFTSPHPANFSKADIDALASIEQLMPYFHLPLQSGDDEILRLMNRKYTTAHFADLVDHIRNRIKGVAIGSDLIIAFPGETRNHYERTKEFLKSMRFDIVYMAIFSPRPGTPAARMVDKFVDHAEAKSRYDELLSIQEQISYELNQLYVGSTQQVLVDQHDLKSGKYVGRTPTNKTVVFDHKDHLQPGDLIPVRIVDAKSWVIYGEAAD